MRLTETPDGGLKLWLSARETNNWATRPGANWPCSILRGRCLFVEFDGCGDLIDLAIDCRSGGRLTDDCSADELNAITTDHIAAKHPNHPCLRGKPQPA